MWTFKCLITLQRREEFQGSRSYKDTEAEGGQSGGMQDIVQTQVKDVSVSELACTAVTEQI